MSTVNNGKALSMTFLYAYMYGLFEKALRFALLYLSLSVAVLRTTQAKIPQKKSNTVTVAVSSNIYTVNNGKAWSMTVLYAYTGAIIYSTDTQLACSSLWLFYLHTTQVIPPILEYM